MATAMEITTTSADPIFQTSETNGALVQVNHEEEEEELSGQSHGDEVVTYQPRPVSNAYTLAQETEDRPGQKKNAKFLPWYTRWGYSISLGAAQGLLRPASVIRDTQDAIRSHVHQPEITKTYECRKTLPVR